MSSSVNSVAKQNSEEELIDVGQKTGLDRLNELLDDPKYEIPAFRRVISLSFHNLGWLRKNLNKTEIDPELRHLLGMSQVELLKVYSPKH